MKSPKKIVEYSGRKSPFSLQFSFQLTDASGDRIPAKHVKLLPLFQGDNAADPSWAVDLKQLDKDHRSTFVENLDRKAGTLYVSTAFCEEGLCVLSKSEINVTFSFFLSLLAPDNGPKKP